MWPCDRRRLFALTLDTPPSHEPSPFHSTKNPSTHIPPHAHAHTHTHKRSLDPSLAPEGRHIVHAFTPDWIDAWQGLSPEEYEAEKERVADEIVARLDAVIPGLAAAVEFREVREGVI